MAVTIRRKFGDPKPRRNPVVVAPFILAALTGAGAAAGSVLATDLIERNTPEKPILQNPGFSRMEVAVGGTVALLGVAILTSLSQMGRERHRMAHMQGACSCEGFVIEMERFSMVSMAGGPNDKPCGPKP